MKKIYLMTLLGMAIFSHIQSVPFRGFMTTVEDGGGFEIWGQANYYSDRQPYLLGGVVFLYPIGLFDGVPHVTVGVEPTVALLPNQFVVYHITLNTALTTVISVFIATITLGTVVLLEAPVGSVMVNIFACDQVSS
jgi:hypothetical protein